MLYIINSNFNADDWTSQHGTRSTTFHFKHIRKKIRTIAERNKKICRKYLAQSYGKADVLVAFLRLRRHRMLCNQVL